MFALQISLGIHLRGGGRIGNPGHGLVDASGWKSVILIAAWHKRHLVIYSIAFNRELSPSLSIIWVDARKSLCKKDFYALLKFPERKTQSLHDEDELDEVAKDAKSGSRFHCWLYLTGISISV